MLKLFQAFALKGEFNFYTVIKLKMKRTTFSEMVTVPCFFFLFILPVNYYSIPSIKVKIGSSAKEIVFKCLKTQI